MKWDHLELLYYLDMTLDTELQGLWKISEYHVLRQSVKKMKVIYAAQVFSKTFASHLAIAAQHGTYIFCVLLLLCIMAFIKCYDLLRKFCTEGCTTTSGRIMPKEGLDTSKFLVFMNDLFDSLNGRGKKNITKWRRLVTRTSGHKRFWIECKRRLQQMQFVHPTTTCKQFNTVPVYVIGYTL